MASVLESCTNLMETAQESIKEQNVFLIRWEEESHRQLLRQAEEMNANGIIRQHGLFPFIMDPDSKVRSEIEAVSRNLRVSPEAAVEYLRRSLDVREEPPEDS